MPLPKIGRFSVPHSLVVAGLFFAVLSVLPTTAQAQVCGNGVPEGGEECDPGGALWVNGDPDCSLADTQASCAQCAIDGTGCPCSTGADCLYVFSCCKFNCQAVGTSNACADGNECTVDGICDAIGNCNPGTPQPPGTTCGSPTDTDCDNADTCDGAGACSDNFESNGFACGDPTATECNLADTCDGAGSCQTNELGPGEACGDSSDTDCTDPDTCDGGGACVPNDATAGVTCGDPADTECTNPDTCDGSGSCSANDETNGTACGDPSDTDCTNPDSCDGTGTCTANDETSGTACGDPSDTECTDADTCDGAGTCDANDTGAGTTAATQCDDTNECTADQCNGSGGCQNPPLAGGTSCGSAADTDCTNADTCDGAGSCDANDEVAGTPAATQCDDSNTCTTDECDGAGACQNPAVANGTACGSAADTECSNPDSCQAGLCDSNDESAATGCDDGLFCTITDTCDGAGTCAGAGDPCAGNPVCQDLCDESTMGCTAPFGTSCGDGDACNGAETCDGAGTCNPGPPPDCDDLDQCTVDSCDLTTGCVNETVGMVGACYYGVLGALLDPARVTRAQFGKLADVQSDVCAANATVGPDSTFSGDLIVTDERLRSEFGLKVKPRATTTSDVITNLVPIKGTRAGGVFGAAPKIVVAGDTVAIPAAGVIDTTGTDPRANLCDSVQDELLVEVADIEALFEGGPVTDLGKVQIRRLTDFPIAATNVGGINLVSMRKTQIGRGASITFDGGGDANTVFLVRVERKFAMAPTAQILTTGAASAGNLLFYVTGPKCQIARQGSGLGTVLCLNGKLKLLREAQWQGALLTGSRVDLRRGATIVHDPFFGLTP